MISGTPNYDGDFNGILEQARHEAHLYTNNAIVSEWRSPVIDSINSDVKFDMKQDAILIENMHDVPYVQDKKIGWEIVSAMTRLSVEIKKIAKNVPCGIQILAGGNKQALAVAKTADLQFIRAEGFVFSHIADEGFTDACAGDILRYRKRIDAENVLIFTDLKKKHSSHAVTSDVSLIETCHAAEFFLTDGIILTGWLITDDCLRFVCRVSYFTVSLPLQEPQPDAPSMWMIWSQLRTRPMHRF